MLQMPDVELLRKIFNYCPETGELSWREQSPCEFKSTKKHTAETECKRWNTTRAGKVVNFVTVKGYITVGINKKRYFAHRIIWKWMTGKDPSGEIDHINGARTDNRWSNLRDVPRAVNGRNMKRSARNSSGVTGVYYHKCSQKWCAYIRPDGKQRYLGLFDTVEEASEARKKAAQELGFHKNHGRTA